MPVTFSTKKGLILGATFEFFVEAVAQYGVVITLKPQYTGSDAMTIQVSSGLNRRTWSRERRT